MSDKNLTVTIKSPSLGLAGGNPTFMPPYPLSLHRQWEHIPTSLTTSIFLLSLKFMTKHERISEIKEKKDKSWPNKHSRLTDFLAENLLNSVEWTMRLESWMLIAEWEPEQLLKYADDDDILHVFFMQQNLPIGK